MGAPDLDPSLKASPPLGGPSRDTLVQRRYTLGFVILASAVALYFCYLMARPFLKPIVFAAVMAIVFYPMHARIWTRVRGPNLAALVSTLAVLLIVFVPVAGLSRGVIGEIRQAYESVSVKSAAGGGWVPYVTEELQRPLDAIGRHVDLSGLDLRAELQSRLEQLSAEIVRSLAAVVQNLGSFVFEAIISFFTLFFLFREGRRVRLTLAAIVPLDTAKVERLFVSINDTIVANVYGVLAVALIQGTLMAIIFAVLRLNSPILWGMVTAACSLVPVVGTALVWLPATIILLATGHWVKAVILLAWSSAFVSLVDHLVRPYVIGSRMKMNTFFVFLSLLGGIKAFGMLGIFVGPLVVSVTFALLGILREEIRGPKTGQPGVSAG